MDLDTRIKNEGTGLVPDYFGGDGTTYQSVVRQASPPLRKNTSDGIASPSRTDSLPIVQEDPSRPQLPAANSDSSSRIRSNPRSIALNEELSGRRSVQFVRESVQLPAGDGTGSPETPSQPISDRRGVGLLSKLKALTTSSGSIQHVRSSSVHTPGRQPLDGDLFTPDSAFGSPTATEPPFSPDYMSPLGSDVDSDGDAPLSIVSAPARRSRRPQADGSQTAPTTPKVGNERERPFFSQWGSSASGGVTGKRSFIRRRRSLGDIRNAAPAESTNQDAENSRRARAAQLLRGLTDAPARTHQRSTSENPRPGHIRRALTSMRDRPDGEPSPWRVTGDSFRNRTEKTKDGWQKFVKEMRIRGRARKMKITIDHVKSAELLAELMAASPAALMLASMFVRDEHGHRRVPILLEQIKLKVFEAPPQNPTADLSPNPMPWFRIELEYGNGASRMKWEIIRTFQEFRNLSRNLRARQKLQQLKVYKPDDARFKLPKFPKHAFMVQWHSMMHELGASDSEDEDEDPATEQVVQETQPLPAYQRPLIKANKSFRDIANMARKLSVPATPGFMDGTSSNPEARRKKQVADACKALEQWLLKILRYAMFRPESNRLCKFLEISALGIRLAAEDYYHGKEGYGRLAAVVPSLMHMSIPQRQAKYLLVRQSYIVVIDSPETMHVYDVFLVDPEFEVRLKKDPSAAKKIKRKAQIVHRVKLKNSERKLKIFHGHERVAEEWTASIRQMKANSPWSKKHRFDSFAPVRHNVYAQWLVDGRDYMWNVSRAIDMAKDVIYIHDWWLSPELYMRRPACISQKWRLDRLLREKARQGVKIFVILYRNVEQAIPIDSDHSKYSLLDLHSNVFVQRSPNQIRQGTFFWAHHEKILVIDHMIAFVGGIDLCFGRWDTPQHTIADDKPTGFEPMDVPRNADNCQMWAGKDYSNPRVKDFFRLGEPYEEMYDRSKVCRMPWHDISMQVVGQPARDLARHFVQRWNFILRQRTPTRPTPMLLPPPELDPKDLEALGLNGTCEVQMLRSCGKWSMGTPTRTEHSIMTAYCAAIQQSDHFVYIENQFFITTCEMGDTVIHNGIGDALVERIKQADESKEKWKAVIVIPLVPGFESTVDAGDGTSIRIIMQCQFRSICRGGSSIFGKLRAAGIDPNQYIKFFSLRSWGEIGPNKVITTEQLYIHAKCMVVDDKIAIIGSANINERSMLGDRDSECAAIVRDTDRLWSTMAGKPYLVGRFPHTLRMRLMREHLGIDVDAVSESLTSASNLQRPSSQEMERSLDTLFEFNATIAEGPLNLREKTAEKATLDRTEDLHSFNGAAPKEQADNPNIIRNKAITKHPKITDNPEHRRDVDGFGADHMIEIEAQTLMSGLKPEHRPRTASAVSKQVSVHKEALDEHESRGPGYAGLPPKPLVRSRTAELGLEPVYSLPAVPPTDDIDIGGPPLQHEISSDSETTHPLIAGMKFPQVTETCMQDPLVDGFYNEIWERVAHNNTEIYRVVFRCQPDDEVLTWSQYKDWSAYAERFNWSQGSHRPETRGNGTGPPGTEVVRPRSRAGSSLISLKADAKFRAFTKQVQRRLVSGKAVDPAKPKNMQKGPHVQGSVDEWAANAAVENEQRGLQNSTKRQGALDEMKPAIDDDNNSLPVNIEKKNRRVAESSDGAEPLGEKNLHAGLEASVEAEPLNEKTPITQKPSEESVKSTRLDTTTTNKSTRNRRTRRARAGTTIKREFKASDDVLSAEEALELLSHVQGHLIVWPTEWLVKEEQAGRWQFGADNIAPIEIYD